MGRLLDIAEKDSIPIDEGTYGVNGVYSVGQHSEKGTDEKITQQDYAINAINAVRVEEKELSSMNTELGRLHEYVIRLRCEDPPKGTRADAFVYLARRIDKLAAQSMEVGGTAEGWPSAADVFADNDQVAILRSALAELEAGPYPAPLPEGCRLLPEADFDPFEYGRLYNGAFSCSHP